MMITEATRQYWLDTVLDWAESRLPPPQYDECKLALTTPAPYVLAELEAVRTEVRSLRATIARVSALLPKWGERITEHEHMSYYAQAERIMACWNDLSAALHPPETPAQAAERVAEHADDERQQLMAEASAEGTDE